MGLTAVGFPAIKIYIIISYCVTVEYVIVRVYSLRREAQLECKTKMKKQKKQRRRLYNRNPSLLYWNNANFCTHRLALFYFIVTSPNVLTVFSERVFVQGSAGRRDVKDECAWSLTTKDCQKTVP